LLSSDQLHKFRLKKVMALLVCFVDILAAKDDATDLAILAEKKLIYLYFFLGRCVIRQQLSVDEQGNKRGILQGRRYKRRGETQLVFDGRGEGIARLNESLLRDNLCILHCPRAWS
jgi:hypothetical protein